MATTPTIFAPKKTTSVYVSSPPNLLAQYQSFIPFCFVLVALWQQLTLRVCTEHLAYEKQNKDPTATISRFDFLKVSWLLFTLARAAHPLPVLLHLIVRVLLPAAPPKDGRQTTSHQNSRASCLKLPPSPFRCRFYHGVRGSPLTADGPRSVAEDWVGDHSRGDGKITAGLIAKATVLGSVVALGRAGTWIA